jgi:Plasmid pRiA4b ORF-3-like protein
MLKTASFKRLILRAVLRQVSPMVRLVSVSDRTDLPELHDVFHAILRWSGDLGYLVRIHGQEFNSFRRSTRSKALRDFQLHRQEKFLYVCDVMDLWEWDVRVLDIQQGIEDDHTPLCLGGRGAPPPEYCGGPRGYRLMLKRQQEGGTIADSASVEATIQMLAWTNQVSQPERGICSARLSMKDGEALTDDWNNMGLWNRIALASRRPTNGCRCSWEAGDCGHEVPNRSDLRKRGQRRTAK